MDLIAVHPFVSSGFISAARLLLTRAFLKGASLAPPASPS